MHGLCRACRRYRGQRDNKDQGKVERRRIMTVTRQRQYVWEFPVRLTHWLNVLCIVVLSVTGIYIGNPFMHAVSSKQYIMGWIRFIHFTAAYLFMMSVIIRLYWAIMGNRYARFRTWFPFSGRALSELGKEIKFYFLLSKEPPSVVGHTALGGLTMLLVFAGFLFQVFSGFAMYSVNHGGAIWTVLGGWLLGLMELQSIRLWHHIAMYLLVVFGIFHVYVAWYSDVNEKNSLMGSIFSGYKFPSGKEYDI
ncbi:MAG: Ni/Fe-hydrogenase, b-type cytochrome subunit [Lentisphaerae bacterium]|nr:MAG: Ni/Fe-hydrogenase, b-type cytochrome subunit [Lentisphaerota bacterium]